MALYKRADGAYVLHRIIQVLPDGYVFLGDNCSSIRNLIFRVGSTVLGVMTSFVRDGKDMRADGRSCLLTPGFGICCIRSEGCGSFLK